VAGLGLDKPGHEGRFDTRSETCSATPEMPQRAPVLSLIGCYWVGTISTTSLVKSRQEVLLEEPA
jgi:hypothetical protein